MKYSEVVNVTKNETLAKEIMRARARLEEARALQLKAETQKHIKTACALIDKLYKGIGEK